ncbi:MAG: hypothetical protein AAB601_03370 [Patescibacteria group bacterium]
MNGATPPPAIPPKTSSARSPKRFWLVVVAALVLFLVLGWILAWQQYLSPEAKQARQMEENVRLYTSFLNEFEAAMRADTWGGQTPEEPLRLFIEALKAGDIALASRYFMLETNERDPNYLTRKRWEEGLLKAQQEGRIEEILSELEKVQFQEGTSPTEVSFESLNQDGIVDVLVELSLNKYSGVWKIEGM